MTSRKPSRELSIGEIFSETFSLYSENFTNYVIPFLVAGAITGLLTTVLRLWIIVPARLAQGSTPQQILNWLPGYLATVIVLAIGTGLVSWVVGSMAQGICIKFASDTLEKGEASLQESFNFAASKILSILAVSIITGVLIFLGLIALIIPGIILALMFSLVVQTIIIENTSALESLGRSRRLVSNRWLKTFALLLVLYIIVGIVSAIASVIGIPFGLGSSLVSSLITALIQPILPIGLTLYYYSMIARTTPQTPTQTQSQRT